MRFSILTLGDNYADVRSHEQFYHEVIDEAVHAERLGFYGFWVGEHHFEASQRVFPAPQMLLAAIAQRTERIRLGTGISVLPVNDPIRLAEDIASLDLLSHGRACFGVGRGYQPHEFAGFNVDMETTKERFWEALAVIRGAWTEPTFSYAGEFYRYEGIQLLPRALQNPHPPIWVAAASPGSAEDAGRRGYAFSAAPFAASPSPEQIRAQLERFRTAYVDAGHGAPPEDLPHVFWCHTARTTAEALATAAAGMKRKLGSATKVWAKPGAGGGSYDAFAKVGQFLATASIDQIDELSIFGDPARCVDKIGTYEAAGVSHLMLMLDWGGLPHEATLDSMQLFAEEVLPHFAEERESTRHEA